MKKIHILTIFLACSVLILSACSAVYAEEAPTKAEMARQLEDIFSEHPDMPVNISGIEIKEDRTGISYGYEGTPLEELDTDTLSFLLEAASDIISAEERGFVPEIAEETAPEEAAPERKAPAAGKRPAIKVPELAKKDLLKRLNHMLRYRLDVLEAVPGLEGKEDESGGVSYAYNGTPLEELDRDVLFGLFRTVNQQLSMINMQRMQRDQRMFRQMQDINRTQRTQRMLKEIRDLNRLNRMQRR